MKNHFSFCDLRNHFFGTFYMLDYRLAGYYFGNDTLVGFINTFIISQEIQCLNQTYISSCWRHPVILYHFTSEVLCYFCKAL